MIYVTRLDGSHLVVNADLIETIEHTADTVITLIDGKKLVVATPVEEVADSVLAYRQAIARGPLRTLQAPPLGSVIHSLHHNGHHADPTPIRQVRPEVK